MDDENKTKINYIDNKKFYDSLVEYRTLCKQNPEEIPRVPEYIGACFLKIANGLATKSNFSGYSWREEMVGEAVETCLRYVKSFDPDKSKNPFSYFTQCCWYSFIGKIQSEKKQSKIKRELIRYAGFDTFTLQGHDEDGEFTVNLNEFMASIGHDEVSVPKPKKKTTPDPLEGFME